MMDDIHSLERRRFLQQGSSAAALAAIAPTDVNATDSRALVFYRAEDAVSVEFAAAMQSKGMRAVALTDDVVRQWRDELQSLVVDHGYKMLGRTGYADYFLLRGLAAEHRIFPLHEQQPSPHSFDWVI